MKGDKCSYIHCGKIAIGYQSTINRGLNVCIDHADEILKQMKPGEKKECHSKRGRFHRYEEEKDET